jgi:hypothetical protein
VEIHVVYALDVFRYGRKSSLQNKTVILSKHLLVKVLQELQYIVSQSLSHFATNGQSVSQSVCHGVEPHLGLMTRYLLTV